MHGLLTSSRGCRRQVGLFLRTFLHDFGLLFGFLGPGQSYGHGQHDEHLTQNDVLTFDDEKPACSCSFLVRGPSTRETGANATTDTRASYGSTHFDQCIHCGGCRFESFGDGICDDDGDDDEKIGCSEEEPSGASLYTRSAGDPTRPDNPGRLDGLAVPRAAFRVRVCVRVRVCAFVCARKKPEKTKRFVQTLCFARRRS